MFTPIVVTATYSQATGEPQQGYVQFDPTTQLTQPYYLLPMEPVLVPLNASGQLAYAGEMVGVPLYATNDPATTPRGQGYTVTEMIGPVPWLTYDVIIPYTAPGGTIDLSELPRGLVLDAEAPTIVSASGISFTTNAAGSFQVMATGFPTPTFTEVGSLPSGVTLSPAGLLHGTPATPGIYSIVITAANGVAPDATQAFTLTVSIGAFDTGHGTDSMTAVAGPSIYPSDTGHGTDAMTITTSSTLHTSARGVGALGAMATGD